MQCNIYRELGNAPELYLYSSGAFWRNIIRISDIDVSSNERKPQGLFCSGMCKFQPVRTEF